MTSTARNLTRANSVVVALLSLLVAIGCQSQTKYGGVSPDSPPAKSGPQLAGPPTRPDEPLARDKGADDERKDYWAKISFSYANFEEVREYVKTYYIDGKIDESRAFAESANFALMEMDPPRELLPVAFLRARKDNPDEEGRLAGKTHRLAKGDDYLIHAVPDAPDDKDAAKKEAVEKEEKDAPAAGDQAEDKNKRLSDDEIRVLRKKRQARQELLEQEWRKISFDEVQFKAVLEYIDKNRGAPKPDTDPTMKRFHVAAAQGFLYSLDPHSSLVSAEAWDESTRETTDSSFEGIGAILTQRDNKTIVESPLEGRPAHASGVRAGDQITHVDGSSIIGLPLHKVVSKIRGEKGTTVKLTVVREGDSKPRIFPIQRAHIDIKNVSGRLLEPHHEGIGYIKVTGFVPTTVDEFDALYADLQKQNQKLHGEGLRGLIFDLRGNSGGLLQQGVKIADRFVESGVIVEVRNRVRQDEVYRARRSGTIDLPVVVLINDGAASASEIVASAIQDNQEGLIVGDRSFGKASVQTLFSPVLRKDYYIKLTIARYFAPSGRTIQVIGVTPDLAIPPEPGGTTPLGFREENLSHYLRPLDAEYKSPNATLATEVAACAELRGIAERIHKNDPNPQLRFDFQLMKAADYMECYAGGLKGDTRAVTK